MNKCSRINFTLVCKGAGPGSEPPGGCTNTTVELKEKWINNDVKQGKIRLKIIYP